MGEIPTNLVELQWPTRALTLRPTSLNNSGRTMATKRTTYLAKLETLAPDALEPWLLARSGLPGRRANLELAAALADLAARGPDPALWLRLVGWATLGHEQAPTNTEREYLPFCAAQALGACHAWADAGQRARIEQLLRAAARDPRWRTREAACFGLQRMGEQDPDALLSLLRRWRDNATLTELRAMLVSLAHPPLLEASAHAVELALQLSDEALGAVLSLEGEAARADDARVLRKSLGFAPSVYTAADPERGFALLRRWAGDERVEVKKLVVANLRKARLARCYPDEIEGVVAVLSWAD